MFRNAHRQHIREEPGHDRRTQKIVETFQAFLDESAVYIENKSYTPWIAISKSSRRS
jgi:hypothetical protein